MLIPATVTCHTSGCPNGEIPIDVDLGWQDEDTGEIYQSHGVTCGPCGKSITDIVYAGS